MQFRHIEFQFKGPRNYIQGPDIFNAMLAEFPMEAPRNIRFTAHEFVRNPHCILHWAEAKDGLKDIAEVRARCQFEDSGARHWLALTEAPDPGPGRRAEYNEDMVTSLCRINGESVTLTGPRPFSFIETIVSMNKHLHLQIFPEAAGKWIFTRIDLLYSCAADSKVALQLKHNLNYRLTRSEITVAGEKVGDLYFSLLKS